LLHTSFHRPRSTAQLVALVGCAAIALLLVLSESAHAQAAKPTTPSLGETTPLSSTITDGGATTSSSGSSGGSLVRTIVGLAVVVAVIYGIAWLLKQGKKKVVGSEDDYGSGLEPTAMLTLAGRTGLHLVKVGNEYLLLGVSDGGVNPIRTYSEEEARAAGFPMDDDDIDALRPVGKDRPALGPGTPFVERLRDLTVRR